MDHEAHCAVLAEWLAAVREVCALARRQQEILAAPLEDGALTAVLDAKEHWYRRAGQLAEQARTAGEPATDAGAARVEASRLRDSLAAALSELDEREARSREALARRMAEVRTELDGLQRGRSVRTAYSTPASGSPRFLDQKR